MSQENVEVIRRTVNALNRGDIAAAFESAAPDAEADLSRSLGPDAGVYNLDEWRRASEAFADSWESRRLVVEEFIDAGEHVVTPFTDHFRGRDGIEVEARGTWVWTFRDGSVARLCLYQERAEALDAAGLSE